PFSLPTPPVKPRLLLWCGPFGRRETGMDVRGGMMPHLLRCVVLAIFLILSATADAVEETRPFPYFVSLGSGDVDLATGTGVGYPIEWFYKRRVLPVEVIARFDHWRQIRDWQGTEGWVHQSMLSAHRTLIVNGEKHALRREPKSDAATVAEVE